MPLRIRAHIDYTGCGPRPKPIVIKEPQRRVSNNIRPWSDTEKATLKDLIAAGATLDKISAFFPHRTQAAIKHVVERAMGKP